jgi:adenosylcobyric acid synthase
MTGRLAPVLMVQGTASHVGKTTLVAAICRILHQDGLDVAPFKAQNMALNSYVAVEGGEIGRAQALQAEAAGVEASVDMNPILLKPEADARSQVIVAGRSIGSLRAVEYQEKKAELWPVVTTALDRLRAQHDVIVAEGAGSPAEINLKHADLSNMRIALHADATVLLVGDIDRGGVFASLLGTLELLDPAEHALVRGVAINKFRGDPTILAPGLEMLNERTGVPVLGVLPYLRGLDLPQEDSLSLDGAGAASSGRDDLDIAVMRLPRIANFDDFDPLRAEPNVRVRYVERASDLGQPDLAIIPGTKTTMADLEWLRGTRLADALCALAEAGAPIFGICGGSQMLGRRIDDPHGSESEIPSTPGLGLLPVDTTFAPVKRTVRVEGQLLRADGPLAGASDSAVRAYEIHMGTTRADPGVRPLVRIERRSGESVDELDGAISHNGLVVGTYLHGLFDNDPLRYALLDWLAARRPGRTALPGPSTRHQTAPERALQLDRLADVVRANLDLNPLLTVCGLA